MHAPIALFQDSLLEKTRGRDNLMRRENLMRGGKSLETLAGKAVDFQCLNLAEPVRLQNEIMCVHDNLPTQQKLSTEKLTVVFKCVEGSQARRVREL